MNNTAAPDISRLTNDIRTEAEKYDTCCMIVVTDGETEQHIELGGADADDICALDCAGGFLLGLSVLMLNDAGAPDLSAPVSEYIPASELPDDAAEECALRLLCRDARLPDPLHGILLPRLHRPAEFAALNGAEASEGEEEALLAHRSLAAQTALLRENEGAVTAGFAPSTLDEAVLVELVRQVSGMSPADFVRRKILELLGIEEASAPKNAIFPEDVVFLRTEGLTALLKGLLDGRLLPENCMNLAAGIARGGYTLPFGRRQEILCARSRICGCTVEMLLDMPGGIGVLVAADSPLPELRRGDGFVRLDVDIAALMNARAVFPAKTRMERLSAKNLADALAVEPAQWQADFVSTPAAAAADASVGQGEAFVIREGRTAVGLLTFALASVPDVVVLDTLIIDRRCQRRGFGRIAVKWAVSYLRKNGASRLIVCVDRRNTAARALYESMGFEISEVHDRTLVMSRVLN